MLFEDDKKLLWKRCKIKAGWKKEQNYSTWYSHVISHHSTDQAITSLRVGMRVGLEGVAR
jgi:hypothetical protein